MDVPCWFTNNNKEKNNSQKYKHNGKKIPFKELGEKRVFSRFEKNSFYSLDKDAPQ